MNRSFEYREIKVQDSTRILHKVLRDDALQMATCNTDSDARALTVCLNAQAKAGKGNAHLLRNDTHIRRDTRHLIMRAWESYNHMGFVLYREVTNKHYELVWAKMGRQAILKNFAKNFHPAQRKYLTFTVEYHPNMLSVERANQKAKRMSVEGFPCAN